MYYVSIKGEGGGQPKLTFAYGGRGYTYVIMKILRNSNGGSCQMLTFDDKGRWEGRKPPKLAYVIHRCSPS